MAKKYFTDESLQTLVDETKSYVDESVSSKADSSALANYYTKAQIDSYEFITVADIDEICGNVTEGSLPQSDIDELMAQLQ